MRQGYLYALASRALGTAPVLQPATPSRFEPEVPQAGTYEISRSSEAAWEPAAGRHAESRPVLGRRRDEDDRWSGPGSGDEPLLGYFEPETPARPGLSTGLAGPYAGVELGGGVGGAPTRGVQVPAATGSFSHGTLDGARQRSRPAPFLPYEPLDAPGRHRATEEAVATVRPAARGGFWHDDVSACPGRREEAQDGERRPGHPAEAAEPTIVVRIGRVDVRAVQPPQPPAPAPRPRPQAAVGLSLADHLLARDRSHR